MRQLSLVVACKDLRFPCWRHAVLRTCGGELVDNMGKHTACGRLGGRRLVGKMLVVVELVVVV